LEKLPGNASTYVGQDDWKRMSQCLHAGRSEAQIQTLFYITDKTSTKDGHLSQRFPAFLNSLDDRSYRDFYKYIVEHDEIRFLDIHRLTGLSEDDGKILPRVMNHVVDWLGEKGSSRGHDEQPARINRRNNKKPPIRDALIPALGHFSHTLIRQAGRRVMLLFAADISGGPVDEMASIVMQQEILEFVYGHLSAFKGPLIKAELSERLVGGEEEQYRRRFLGAEWAAVLGIVRKYMEAEFRPKWVTSEQYHQQDGAEASGLGLASALLSFAKSKLDCIDYDALRQDVRSRALEEKLGRWLKSQYEQKNQAEEEDEKEEVGEEGSSPGEHRRQESNGSSGQGSALLSQSKPASSNQSDHDYRLETLASLKENATPRNERAGNMKPPTPALSAEEVVRGGEHKVPAITLTHNTASPRQIDGEERRALYPRREGSRSAHHSC
jgi:hypothetical protein